MESVYLTGYINREQIYCSCTIVGQKYSVSSWLDDISGRLNFFNHFLTSGKSYLGISVVQSQCVCLALEGSEFGCPVYPQKSQHESKLHCLINSKCHPISTTQGYLRFRNMNREGVMLCLFVLFSSFILISYYFGIMWDFAHCEFCQIVSIISPFQPWRNSILLSLNNRCDDVICLEK